MIMTTDFEAGLRLLMLAALFAAGDGLRVTGVSVPSVVVAGSTVRLMCSYEQRHDRPDPLYSVKWYRGVDQFYEYVPRRDPSIRVYPLHSLQVDEKKSHKATVVLKGVTKDTSGVFRCEVMGDKPLFETDDHTENMTVIEVPQKDPELISEVLGNRVRPGDIVVLRCTVGASDPPVDLIWLINNREPPSYGIFRTTTHQGHEDKYGRRNLVSEMEMVVTEDSFMRGAMTVQCQATLSTVYKRSANITFIHADHPQPAGFGWFSSGTRVWFSLVILEATVGALCLLLVC